MTTIDFNQRKVEKYIEGIRPPVDIRERLDIGFSFKKNELIIFEIRPKFNDKTIKLESPFAKVKFIKTQQVWKIYWMRASGKWVIYEPAPQVTSIDEFFEILDEDAYACFKG